ncbi:glycosyltransferase [Pontixanthobacter gangjinensis]|nr:glycosyltransferase [Pontixanthobacter gangjinensis]
MREQLVGFGTSLPPSKTEKMAQAFRGAVPELAGRPYILFLSRLHEKKGCEVLLNGYGAVADKVDFDLVMAGPGNPQYARELQALAKESGSEARIHFPGMLTGEAKWGALYGCEAMALTSHQENFGVVVAESLGCGRPVIISDQVNIHQEVADAQAGLICADNQDGAAAALLAFSELGTAERKVMGARCKDLFEAKFDIAKTAALLARIFEDASKLRTAASEVGKLDKTLSYK